MAAILVAMKCPNDETVLQLSERQGIEIDYCPACRGVWLDRGELDKIIERVSAEQEPPRPAPADRDPRYDERYDERRRREWDDRKRRDWDDDRWGKRPKKRKGLLGELFDFD